MMKLQPLMDLFIQTKNYYDYILEHHSNVQKAWTIIQKNCSGKGFSFLYDDHKYFTLDFSIRCHDQSKFSQSEFVQYRRKFHQTASDRNHLKEIDQNFDLAWNHHKEANDHHWENWTVMNEEFPGERELCLVHNICDWMAMGVKFGDTAKDYYENNKDKILIPEWAEKTMYEIFEVIYPGS